MVNPYQFLMPSNRHIILRKQHLTQPVFQSRQTRNNLNPHLTNLPYPNPMILMTTHNNIITQHLQTLNRTTTPNRNKLVIVGCSVTWPTVDVGVR
ncbi:hypothetical protein HanRHA438_Chr01g0023851 [Helianthus annuus]|nr:hypothetical protein HanRHA438_Chr01g0023851 [Helianthus annuus]